MNHMHGSYDFILVLFSYIVAVASSYAVLDIVDRISASGGAKKRIWLVLGSCAMGMGIWSMHFVGMMAFTLPVQVAYDIPMVILSVVAAIGASFASLLVVGRNASPSFRRLLGGATCLASGIIAMHYIGMAAMEIGLSYKPIYVALSVLIAFLASVAAFWLAFYFRRSHESGKVRKKLVSGFIMGAAIAGMHYTGMIAAVFQEAHNHVSRSGILLEKKGLAYFIAFGTLFTLGLCLAGLLISKRFSRKDNEIEEKTHEIMLMNQELRKLNENLEELVKERTAQLEKAHDEAIQANLIKSQFLANMSHELRTPLNAIIGYSEMLMEEAEELDQPVFSDDLGKIGKAGKHLLSLINDILDISKIEAGKMDVYMETGSLEDFAADVMTTMKPLIEESGNTIQQIVSRGVITTDMTKLRQILINFIGNANKFTHQGFIVLEIKEEVRSGRSGYAFSVKDSGIGMSAEQVAKLFQPFTQADASTTRKYGGTGLGLAISQRFSELLGGEISVESTLGEGSTFACWLPIAAREDGLEDPSDGALTEPSFSADNHQVNILLIDDEPFNQQLLKRYIAHSGWSLAFAESGAEGLEMARKLQPSVICLDILMPSMDGWSVLAALKNDPQLKDIPVVIWSMTGNRQLGYSLGASEFVTKPVNKEKLLNVLDQYIHVSGGHPILVIEDDATTSNLMARLLVKEGYDVSQAVNGRDALRLMASEKPSLILLDLMMPEMDGFQFVEELRTREEWQDIPIIVLTAKSITLEDRHQLSGYVKSVIQKGSYNHKSIMEEINRQIADSANIHT